MNHSGDITKSSTPLWIPCLLLTLITFTVFGRVCTDEFVNWDDNSLIYGNAAFNPPTLKSIAGVWEAPHLRLYIPVTYTMWGGLASIAQLDTPDEQGTQLNPWVFHTANLFVHITNVLLAFAILRLITRRTWPAFAGALLFALHPIQTEAVAWATGMKDLLSGFFSLLALWQYLLFASSNRRDLDTLTPHSSPSRPYLHYTIGAIALILANLAKPGAVVIPPIAAVLDWLIFRRPLKSVVKSTSLWLALAIPPVIWTIIFQPTVGIPLTAIWTRPFIAAYSLVFYLKKFFFPNAFAIDYGLTPPVIMQSAFVYFTPLILLLVIGAIAAYRAGRRYLFASLLVFIFAPVPVLGLAPFVFQYYSTVADRYIYLGLLGPALALAWFLIRFPKRPLFFAVAILIALLGIRSFVQAGHWENCPSLYQNTIDINPKSFIAYNNRGLYYQAQGEVQRLLSIRLIKSGKTTEAQEHRQQYEKLMAIAEEGYRQSIAARDNCSISHSNLSIILANRGDFDGSIRHAILAIDLVENLPPELRCIQNDHYTLGLALMNLGRYQEAVVQFKRMLQVKPDHPDAKKQLDLAEQKLRQPTTREKSEVQNQKSE